MELGEIIAIAEGSVVFPVNKTPYRMALLTHFRKLQAIEGEGDTMSDEKFYLTRAQICRKYSQQFWEEQNAGKYPNLALIINDAIAEGIDDYMNYLSGRKIP